jgi:hypothetical protein
VGPGAGRREAYVVDMVVRRRHGQDMNRGRRMRWWRWSGDGGGGLIRAGGR